ncbi:UNVERIFIED_CONTAM: NAD(P)H-quinone oxidoreductase subunit S, chloroplastic [Sesamum angustifolium]|uniref:NAD(P)H-quinone oxidoreductase subunit S, chloroplastic n=1 Tax=Sesamum angustifolium TaxID=2727405 RepID=A0AAW2MJW6_9LAMI
MPLREDAHRFSYLVNLLCVCCLSSLNSCVPLFFSLSISLLDGKLGVLSSSKFKVSPGQSCVLCKAECDRTSSELCWHAKFFGLSEDAFEKELLGLTGGFPGGEKGLKKFIEQNPPPKKGETSANLGFDQSLVKKPKPPELPLLLPGMIAIVKNPSNPFYMYCGIVQRITDGKAGVLFEGGNWDRLITFRLEELERREKGPPMVNPRSVILEEMVEKSS